MKKLLSEIKQHFTFKDSTEVGDILLLVAKEPEMLVYALVTGIEPDKSRRDEWWKLEMQVLTIPPQAMTWTLRWEQFTGQEIFTMGGEERFVQAVQLDAPEQKPPKKTSGKKNKAGLRLVK